MTNAPYLLPDAPGRLPHRRQEGRRLDDVRRPVLRLRPGRHGRRHREVRRLGRHRPRAPGRPRRRVARACRRAPRRTACSTTRSSPVEVPQRKGDPIVFTTDEGVRADTTAESLGQLRPAFDKAGNITAGNASQISDGGAAVIVMSKAAAERTRRAPRSARSSATARWPVPTRRCSPSRRGPSRRPSSRPGKSVSRRRPVRAQRGVRRRRGRRRWTTSASPTTSSTSTAAPSPSATRSACRAPASRSRSLHELARRGGGLGAAALCGGGGQGDALLVKHGLTDAAELLRRSCWDPSPGSLAPSASVPWG